ncbi:hypothetical protein TD95_003553 [Thielaviopsis punctulata]|uniref:Peptidase C15, pyroglutamyl peptidase I-like protein n=1 Tax=Thielaviopsis punctulata TaxID=72032 RepID=A0A0F4ZH36_9PEZI|nr:hypothetical protein TD95_003553 [Thielaviopsis punctulata]
MDSPSSEENQKQYTVLVTGYGPFRGFPKNPSWEIADSLPEYLPLPTDSEGNSTTSPLIRIVVYHEPIHVGYDAVREIVPRLWDVEARGEHYDFCVHIGMAGAEIEYKLERLAHRDGYSSKDVDGKLLDQTKDNWGHLPSELHADMDTEDVMKRWEKNCPQHTKLRLSDDPGRYLCDYIFYSSLALLTDRKEEKRVVFLHVPDNFNVKAIEYGNRVCLALIKSLIESKIAKTTKEKATAE